MNSCQSTVGWLITSKAAYCEWKPQVKKETGMDELVLLSPPRL